MEQEQILERERKQQEVKKEEVAFKVGDPVLITRRAELKEMCSTEWPSSKDETIGKVGVVREIQHNKTPIMYRVEIPGDYHRWHYPACVMKKMSKWKLKKHQEKQTK